MNKFSFFIFIISLTVLSNSQKSDPIINDQQNQAQSSTSTGFLTSFTSILVSEIGDKTFIIAALMAMKYNKIHVWIGAVGALIVMTLLSCIFGAVVPTLIPVVYTQFAAMVLFFVFGGLLLRDWYNHEETEGENEEMKEAELELQNLDQKLMSGANDQDIETNEVGISNKNKNQNITYTIIWQAFYLTFLNEWGDRSQFSTIALAAVHQTGIVFIGGSLGHITCTTLAIICGKLIAEKISEKTVSLMGGLLFTMFGALQLISLVRGE